MDNAILFSDLITLVPLLIGGYLLIYGISLLITKYTFKDLFVFGIVSLTSGLVLLTSNSNLLNLNELASLLSWPAFYLFLHFQRKSVSFSKRHLAHLIFPFVWFFLSFIVSENFQSGVFNTLYLTQWLIYVWMCITEVYKSNQSSKFKSYFLPGYIRLIFYGLIFLIIVRFGIPIIYQDYALHKNIIDITTAIYLIAISSYFIHRPLNFSTDFLQTEPTEEVINYEETMKRKLSQVMTKEKVFLNPELTLNELADKLEIKVSELSQFINSNLNKNFNDFVNEYRVNEFKRLVSAQDVDSKATVIELAFDSGFNSKASFNRIFKEATGMTPSEYRKSSQTS